MFSDKIFTGIGINKETQQMDCTQNGYHLFPLVQVLQNGVSKYDILYWNHIVLSTYFQLWTNR